MATFVLIHGAGDRAFFWHLVIPELRARGHDVVAMDLPCGDESAGLSEYADAVVDAIGERTELILVAHSFGGFTAPLVCARVPVQLVVLVAAMIPAPRTSGEDFFADLRRDRPARDRSDDDSEDALFLHDVPPAVAAAVKPHWREQASNAWSEPWPLEAWPDVPTRVLLCREDRVFPAEWLRRIARDRLSIDADEIDGGHMIALSRPHELARRLDAYATALRSHRAIHADAFDAEIRALDEHFRRATRIAPGERVLDIGCGTGESTRAAAAASSTGRVLGVDVSQPMLDVARRLSRDAGLDVIYEHADAAHHRFAAGYFDVAISRFGTMFFADPIAAFTNIAGAVRTGGRLVLLVWQRRELNEWAVALDDALEAAPLSPPLDAFSLGDPETAQRVLAHAGFSQIRFADVHEPVFYGKDVDAALALIGGFRSTRDALARANEDDAARLERRLRAVLAAHLRDDGVFFDARAWLVTAVR